MSATKNEVKNSSQNNDDDDDDDDTEKSATPTLPPLPTSYPLTIVGHRISGCAYSPFLPPSLSTGTPPTILITFEMTDYTERKLIDF